MTGEICASNEFVIKLGEEEVSAKPTLDAPTFAIVEKPFKVKGTTPKPNQEVWIELEKFGLDEKIASGTSDSEHKFEIEIQLTELGFVDIHSEIEKFGLNPTSPTKSILVLNYLIIGGIALAVFLVLWKQKVIQKVIGGKK